MWCRLWPALDPRRTLSYGNHSHPPALTQPERGDLRAPMIPEPELARYDSMWRAFLSKNAALRRL